MADFRFQAPAAAAVTAGQGADLALGVTRLNGFSAGVDVTVAGLPAGLGAAPLTLPGSASAGTLHLEATAAAAPGTASLTITASGGGLARSATCTLTVNAAAAPTFDFAPAAGTVSLAAGASLGLTVALERQGGHVLPVTCSVEGAGNGLAAAFNPVTTAGSQTVLTLSADPGAAPGARSLTLRATDGTLVRTQGLVVTVQPAATGIAAFPGAEGWGAAATGGRGGRVLHVTTLAADPAGAIPGSLQWACNQEGPRYILFRVSGLINGDIQLTRPDVTIAGHTSPGGILVRQFHTTEDPYCDGDPNCLNAGSTRKASNWILRHLRMRPAGGGQDDALRILSTHTAIVDHCSMANAVDECVQLSASHDVTVQDSILAETLGEHANLGGMLVNYSVPAAGLALDRLSILRNAWIRLLGRLPELSRESPAAAGSVLNLELSNNLLWDPGFYIDVNPTTISGGEGQAVYFALNWIGNFAFLRPGHPYGLISFPVNTPVGATRTRFFDNRTSLYAGRADYQLNYCCNDYPDTVANPAMLPYPGGPPSLPTGGLPRLGPGAGPGPGPGRGLPAGSHGPPPPGPPAFGNGGSGTPGPESLRRRPGLRLDHRAGTSRRRGRRRHAGCMGGRQWPEPGGGRPHGQATLALPPRRRGLRQPGGLPPRAPPGPHGSAGPVLVKARRALPAWGKASRRRPCSPSCTTSTPNRNGPTRPTGAPCGRTGRPSRIRI
jgi:hypothetical protein